MVVEYVTGLKTAWEVAKSLKAATDAIDDAELKLQMAELISALADAKIEASENTEEIVKLKKVIATKKKLTYEAPFYWLIDETEKKGPFCQHCNDKDGKTVRLQNYETNHWHCSVCQNSYNENNQQSSGSIVSVNTSSLDFTGYDL